MFSSFIKRNILFLSFLLSLAFSHAQVDSSYIEPFPYNFSAEIYSSYKFTSILHEYLLEDNTYEPNVPPGLGIGFATTKIGLSIGYGFNFLRDKAKGETKSLDLQYHHYGKKLIFDLYGQVYQGFYIDNEEKLNYNIFQDLKILKLGFFGQYVFNSKRFSYRAAFKQSEKQIKSAGSFLLGGEFYYSQIHSDIPYFFSDSIDSYTKHSSLQFGPNLGYAYTWAVSKRYYISLSVTAGFNIGFNEESRKPMVFPTTFPRFATGYNADTWSLSLTYINNMIYTYFSEDRQIALNSGRILFTFTKRFHVNSRLLNRLSFLDKIIPII